MSPTNSMNYVTADHHFGHTRILHYERNTRPWVNVRDMDNYLIDAWNSVVTQNDLVYYLGDFALCSKSRKIEIMSQLNGTKICIRGNHDSGYKHLKEIGFAEVYPWLILKLMPKILEEEKYILLIHDANDITGKHVGFDGVLCGHWHSKIKTKGKALNIGIDNWGFKPISLAKALETFGINLDSYNIEVI